MPKLSCLLSFYLCHKQGSGDRKTAVATIVSRITPPYPKSWNGSRTGCTFNDAHYGEKNRFGSSRFKNRFGDRYSPPMPVSWDERDQQQHRIPLGILENVGVQGTCNLLWRQQAHKCNNPGHQGKSRSQWPQVCPSPLLEWEKNWQLPWDLSRILKSAKREVS